MTLILVILFPLVFIASLVVNILITPLNWLNWLTIPGWLGWGVVLILLTWSLRNE